MTRTQAILAVVAAVALSGCSWLFGPKVDLTVDDLDALTAALDEHDVSYEIERAYVEGAEGSVAEVTGSWVETAPEDLAATPVDAIESLVLTVVDTTSFEFPDVTGLTPDEAEQLLEDAIWAEHVNVQLVTSEPTTTADIGTVIAVEELNGRSVEAGDTIDTDGGPLQLRLVEAARPTMDITLLLRADNRSIDGPFDQYTSIAPDGTETAATEFDMNSFFGDYRPIGEPCYGAGGYSDLSPGANVTVRDASGTIVATETLGEGEIVFQEDVSGDDEAEYGDLLYDCVFELTVTELPVSDFYELEIAGRDGYTVELSDVDNVELTLGDE